MSRKARRRAQRTGTLLPGGPRWTRLARGMRRQARAGLRTARSRRNELAITILYAIAGALCLAFAALLIAGPGVDATVIGDAPLRPTTLPAPGPTLRAALIGGVALGGVGLILLALALARLRAWWRMNQEV